MLETVVMVRIVETRKSVPQLNVLAARNMGSMATHGEQLNIRNSDTAIALSDSFVWLWSCAPVFNLPMMINMMPSMIKIALASGSKKVSVYFFM